MERVSFYLHKQISNWRAKGDVEVHDCIEKWHNLNEVFCVQTQKLWYLCWIAYVSFCCVIAAYRIRNVIFKINTFRESANQMRLLRKCRKQKFTRSHARQREKERKKLYILSHFPLFCFVWSFFDDAMMVV